MPRKKVIGAEREAWALKNPCVQNWLGRVGKGTATDYLATLHRYYGWLQDHGGPYSGKGLDELLEMQDKAVGRERYGQLERAQAFISSVRSTARWKALMYSSIRSFYLHNRVELPKDISFKIRGDYVTTETDLDLRGFLRVLGAANRVYRAVFLAMYGGGMGVGEAVAFSHRWEEVRGQVESGSKVIRVSLPGRKGNWNVKPFYTLLGRDAADALREYVSRERGPIGEGEAIFLNDQFKPVTEQNIGRAFRSYAMKVGVIRPRALECPDCGGNLKKFDPGHGRRRSLRCLKCGKVRPHTKEFFLPCNTRYQTHPHEIRSLFRSEWHKSGADPMVAEFFMGHVERIDTNHYNRFYKDSDYVMEQYRIAAPYLNVLTEDPRTVPRAEVRDLNERVGALTQSLEEVQRENRVLREGNKRLDYEKRIEELERIVRAMVESPYRLV